MKNFLLVVLVCLMSCTGSKDVGTVIQQIELESNGCYGFCPSFTLTVQHDGTARYDARRYNPQQGQFTTTIKMPQLDSLLQLINNANYFSLQDKYPAMVSDVIKYKSTLTLKTGFSKTIIDEGPGGPPPLRALYSFMLSLRTSQDWQ